jgi:hypothetical protein
MGRGSSDWRAVDAAHIQVQIKEACCAAWLAVCPCCNACPPASIIMRPDMKRENRVKRRAVDLISVFGFIIEKFVSISLTPPANSLDSRQRMMGKPIFPDQHIMVSLVYLWASTVRFHGVYGTDWMIFSTLVIPPSASLS